MKYFCEKMKLNFKAQRSNKMTGISIISNPPTKILRKISKTQSQEYFRKEQQPFMGKCLGSCIILGDNFYLINSFLNPELLIPAWSFAGTIAGINNHLRKIVWVCKFLKIQCHLFEAIDLLGLFETWYISQRLWHRVCFQSL